MSRALLIGKRPGVELGVVYVDEGAYDCVVIGSLSTYTTPSSTPGLLPMSSARLI